MPEKNTCFDDKIYLLEGLETVSINGAENEMRKLSVGIVGCGGITSWRDAVEFMLAGATAVQIGTAIAYKGLNVFGSVARGIDAYLKKKGFKNVKEIVGLAHNF